MEMKEILTNLVCLWGGRGPVLQPNPLRNSAGTAISAILTILGCLWGEVEVLLLLETSSSPQLRHLSWFKYRCVGFGAGLPLIGGGGTVEYLTNISRGQAITRISDEYF